MKKPLLLLLLVASFVALHGQQFSLIKDINPGSQGSNVCYITRVGNMVYFAANNGSNGMELWKSDGTDAGTAMVMDIYPGATSSSIGCITKVGTTIFFVANNGVSGSEIWKSDGTTAGTVMIKDIRNGGSGSNPAGLVAMNNIVYFSADNGAAGRELWKSDGTTAGTVLVKDIRAVGGSSPQSLAAVNGTLYFSATDGVKGNELWKSDGTSAGTVMVKDIRTGAADAAPSGMVAIGSKVYFAASNGTAGTELWTSDGTAAGTVMVKDILPGSGESFPANLMNVSGKLYFAADNGSSGIELWCSDGTAAGTRLVKDIWPGTSSGASGNFSQLINKLIFTANDGVNGLKTWQSDGSAAGTKIATALADPGDGSLSELVETDTKVYASIQESSIGTELWGIGYTNILPLDFLSFDGRIIGGDAKLDWSTANEVSMDEFIVERSVNGRDYTQVGRVPAKNLSVTNAYSFVDREIEKLAVGVVYYRVRQVDIFSKSTYSRVVALQWRVSVGISIFPVPVKDRLNISATMEHNDRLTCQLYDNTGRILSEKSVAVVAGNNSIGIPMERIAAGTYFVRITGERLSETKKFLKN